MDALNGLASLYSIEEGTLNVPPAAFELEGCAGAVSGAGAGVEAGGGGAWESDAGQFVKCMVATAATTAASDAASAATDAAAIAAAQGLDASPFDVPAAVPMSPTDAVVLAEQGRHGGCVCCRVICSDLKSSRVCLRAGGRAVASDSAAIPVEDKGQGEEEEAALLGLAQRALGASASPAPPVVVERLLADETVAAVAEAAAGMRQSYLLPQPPVPTLVPVPAPVPAVEMQEQQEQQAQQLAQQRQSAEGAGASAAVPDSDDSDAATEPAGGAKEEEKAHLPSPSAAVTLLCMPSQASGSGAAPLRSGGVESFVRGTVCVPTCLPPWLSPQEADYSGARITAAGAAEAAGISEAAAAVAEMRELYVLATRSAANDLAAAESLVLAAARFREGYRARRAEKRASERARARWEREREKPRQREQGQTRDESAPEAVRKNTAAASGADAVPLASVLTAPTAPEQTAARDASSSQSAADVLSSIEHPASVLAPPDDAPACVLWPGLDYGYGQYDGLGEDDWGLYLPSLASSTGAAAAAAAAAAATAGTGAGLTPFDGIPLLPSVAAAEAQARVRARAAAAEALAAAATAVAAATSAAAAAAAKTRAALPPTGAGSPAGSEAEAEIEAEAEAAATAEAAAAATAAAAEAVYLSAVYERRWQAQRTAAAAPLIAATAAAAAAAAGTGADAEAKVEAARDEWVGCVATHTHLSRPVTPLDSTPLDSNLSTPLPRGGVYCVPFWSRPPPILTLIPAVAAASSSHGSPRPGSSLNSISPLTVSALASSLAVFHHIGLSLPLFPPRAPTSPYTLRPALSRLSACPRWAAGADARALGALGRAWERVVPRTRVTAAAVWQQKAEAEAGPPGLTVTCALAQVEESGLPQATATAAVANGDTARMTEPPHMAWLRDPYTAASTAPYTPEGSIDAFLLSSFPTVARPPWLTPEWAAAAAKACVRVVELPEPPTGALVTPAGAIIVASKATFQVRFIIFVFIHSTNLLLLLRVSLFSVPPPPSPPPFPL